MRHLLIPAAFVVGAQPVLADVGGPDGATVVAVLMVMAWGVLMVMAPKRR